MIKYDPFWKTLKKKKISTYSLINDYGFSKGLIDNIKHNRSLTTYTINTILDKLDIKLSDFMEYKPKNKAN